MITTIESKLLSACEPVSVEEAFGIIERLEEELEASPIQGIGLAANQININKRVCILRVPNFDNERPAIYGYNFVNPVISEKKNPILVKNEGCLSYPGKYVETLRYRDIVVKDSLEPAGRKLTGWAAVCCQHETDHLNGVTMYMRRRHMVKATDPCPCDSGKPFKSCCYKAIKKDPEYLE